MIVSPRTFLISMPRFRPGRALGAETYLTGLLSGLHRLETPHRVVLHAGEAALDWVHEHAPAFQTLVARGGRLEMMFDVVSGRSVAAAARSVRADAVMYPLNLGAPLAQPTLLFVHDLVADFYRRRFPGSRAVRMRLQAWLLERSIRCATATACPTAVVADEVRRSYGLPEERLSVISLAALEGPPPTPPGDLVQRIGGRPFILQASSSLPHKDHVTGVKGFALARSRLLRKGINPVLVVTGDAESAYGSVSELVASEALFECVIFAGRLGRHELEWLVVNAFCHLMPTLYEGFGLGLVEAQERGRPVAASDIPVLREVADQQAVFFAPESPDSVCEALITLFMNPRLCEELGAAGRVAAQRFGWDRHAREVMNLLADISAGTTDRGGVA